jgi:hypothetical protein
VVGSVARVVELAGKEGRLAELQDAEGMEVRDPRRLVRRHRLPQERATLPDASRCRVRVT